MLLPAASPKTILSTLRAAILHSFVQAPARPPTQLPTQPYARLICLLIALVAFPTIYLQAQEPGTDDEVVRVNTDLLVFPIRVKDKRGQAATTLTERELLLKDADHVITGMFLYPGADRVALVFALDQSGSLREIVSQQREAALALFGRFGERSQVAVLRFAEEPSLVAPFGRDASVAREAFDFPIRDNQHTAIFDAAAAAVAAFDVLTRVRSERRIVVLISDGLDNVSSTKAGPVIQAALEKQVSFYVIHLPLFEPRDGRLAVRSPARGFRDLAEKTGGKYFLVGNARATLAPAVNKTNDLTAIFQAIEEDLRSQYLLGFYAGETSRDGRKHRFSLSMPSGVEYQIPAYGYSRTHEFFVTPHGAEKVSR